MANTGYCAGYGTVGWSSLASNNYVTAGTIQISGSSTAYGTITISPQDYVYYGNNGRYLDEKDGKLVVPKGSKLQLPDGTVLNCDDLGNVQIDDSAAKVVYAANRMREFNPFVNASDLLASFIRDVGSLGITREELGKLPIPLFINWLVVKAAEQDNDPIPEGVVPLAQHPVVQRLLPKMPEQAA